jgi:mRNA-degrading endonuclease RelE of RelBE toxin-antitoxin system
VQFIETRAFTRRIVNALSDNDYRELQRVLVDRPLAGDLIRGTGGIRKLRWGDEGRGKRGAYRVIYYWHATREIFLMLFLYAKADQNDLTPDQRRVLGAVVREEFK